MVYVKKIYALAGFVEAVNKLSHDAHVWRRTTPLWFRGQGNSAWPLRPRLYRKGCADPRLEREMVRDFRLRAPSHLSRIPANYLEWVFLMQHHGMHTRLLDWTEEPLVALYFALADVRQYRDADVLIIDPWELNEKSLLKKTVPTAEAEIVAGYSIGDKSRTCKAEYPCGVRPTYATQRIVAQRGCFTIHGSKKASLNDFCRGHGIPIKTIRIPKTARANVLRELLSFGITEYKLFPDLDGLCKEIVLYYTPSFRGVDHLAIERSESCA